MSVVVPERFIVKLFPTHFSSLFDNADKGLVAILFKTWGRFTSGFLQKIFHEIFTWRN